MQNSEPSTELPIVQVRGLSKGYGKTKVLHGIDFTIPAGKIYGLIGHNGAGKTTAINTLLGLTNYEGDVRVLGLEPFANRAELMRDIAFISDVASLPRFLKVNQLLNLMEGIHPNFVRQNAEQMLEDTDIRGTAKIKSLSKGMLAQLHLAVVMAIDARLLVLDEPTLGLDITFRKKFYRRLVEDYMSENRSILITTHQVDEIEFLLSDLIFIREGDVVLNASMDDISQRFVQVLVSAEQVTEAMNKQPIFSTKQLGQNIMIFDGLDMETAESFGTTSTPSVSDLFVALMERKDDLRGTQ
ncbi:MAG TPA: ABC transporter ATP-binding protein [Devosia sp.]|nr:ABC transporter ATP-binding protein [Devosia sp.]